MEFVKRKLSGPSMLALAVRVDPAQLIDLEHFCFHFLCHVERNDFSAKQYKSISCRLPGILRGILQRFRLSSEAGNADFPVKQ